MRKDEIGYSRGIKMTTMEQRVSALEGIYPHLATKEDVAGVRGEVARVQGELAAEIARSESRMVRWMAAWTIGGMIGIAGLVTTVAKFLA